MVEYTFQPQIYYKVFLLYRYGAEEEVIGVYGDKKFSWPKALKVQSWKKGWTGLDQVWPKSLLLEKNRVGPTRPISPFPSQKVVSSQTHPFPKNKKTHQVHYMYKLETTKYKHIHHTQWELLIPSVSLNIPKPHCHSLSLHSTFYLCLLFGPLAKKCAPSFFSFWVLFFFFYDLGISHFSQCLTCVYLVAENPGKKIKEFLFLFFSLIYFLSCFSSCLAKIIFVNLFYYLTYFCYYLQILLYFFNTIYESHYTILIIFYLYL